MRFSQNLVRNFRTGRPSRDTVVTAKINMFSLKLLWLQVVSLFTWWRHSWLPTRSHRITWHFKYWLITTAFQLCQFQIDWIAKFWKHGVLILFISIYRSCPQMFLRTARTDSPELILPYSNATLIRSLLAISLSKYVHRSYGKEFHSAHFNALYFCKQNFIHDFFPILLTERIKQGFCININVSRHWGRDQVAANLQTMFSHKLSGVGGAVRFLVGGTIGKEEKNTTGSALDGTVLDFTQILAYLVQNMSRSQLYLGFGHFGRLS